MYLSHSSTVLTALTIYALLGPTAAQTYSSCNPLLQSKSIPPASESSTDISPGGCPADPALGRSVNVHFTSGASDEFSASGGPTYGSDGAAFTVSQSGDAPSISSKWYIMFGHVDFEVKAAPGTGIVSAAILQSDCLDEIDWEWLGGDDTQAQSNYFGKGITTTGYNRGAFHGAPNNHDQFHTYSIDWTADQIVWSIDGTTVRAMTQDQAESGQYPQTPMYVKVGAWAGGDPSNPPGTIEWAGGITDYSAGPFTMYLKSIQVTDYSTGSQYSYSGTTGTWQSIVSSGGQINGQGNGAPISTGSAPAVTSSVPNNAPLGFGNNDNDNASVLATRTGWPWSGSATATAVVSASIAGLTSQCSPCSSPITICSQLTFFQDLSLTSSSLPYSSLESTSYLLETVTSYDEQGFPTLVTIDPAALTAPKSYDSQGFLISTPVEAGPSPTLPQTETPLPPSSPGSARSTTEISTSTGPEVVTGSAVVNTPFSASTYSISYQSEGANPSPSTSETTTIATSSAIGLTSETTTLTTSTQVQSAAPTTSSSSTSSGADVSDINLSTSLSPAASQTTTTPVSTEGSERETAISSTTSITSTVQTEPQIEPSSSSSLPLDRSSISSQGSSTGTEHYSTSRSPSSKPSTTLATSGQSSIASTTSSTSPTASGTPPAVSEAGHGQILHLVTAIITTGLTFLLLLLPMA